MKQYNRILLDLPPDNCPGKPGVVLRPGETLPLTLVLPRRDEGSPPRSAAAGGPYPVRRRLRIVGETDLFWRWKIEEGMPPAVFRSIVDALDDRDAPGEKYGLRLRGRGETWPRNAFARVRLDHHLRRDRLRFCVQVKASALRVAREGELGVELGIYLARPGRHPDDVFDPPDRVIRLEIPPGSYDWRTLSRDVRLPDHTAILLVRVGGSRFAGQAWVGSPRLFHQGGDTVIPPFMPDNPHWPHFNWLGENLSRKEWPEFEVTVDGRRVFAGAVFNSIFRRADFEVPLRELAPGRHRATVRLVADYAAALPFVVKAAEVLEESARAVEVIACPEYAKEGTRFPVLIERNGPDVHRDGGRLDVVRLSAGAARASARYELKLRGGGPQARCIGRGPQTPRFAFGDPLGGPSREEIRLRRVVRGEVEGDPKREEGDPAAIKGGGDPKRLGTPSILLSTGDSIYLPQTPEDFTRFLCWYVANRLGNSICFRPVYRWSGSREVNPPAWRAAVALLKKLGMHYYLLMDGRELPGKSANPPASLLQGPGFLGMQAHEHDGAFCYWGPGEDDGLFTDIFRRSKQTGSSPPLRAAMRNGNNVVGHFDRWAATNMKEAAELFVREVARSRGPCTRHTGPSTLFRYFLRAGYDWVGAEQMYGPEEVVLASLRGACRAAGKTDCGAHLAMQWSSGPQDSPRHAERYFLSLAACYLQGVNHINLEEGLWRMEADYAGYDRFSDACESHRQAHAKFRRFLQTHPRRGTLRVPVAVFQGRYCGWRCFGRGGWASLRPEFRFGPPEESFDLLKVFYPRSVLDAIYRYPCPEDRPQGWYTGTPFGPVDLLPIEAPARVLGDYQAISFLGWNTFNEGDFRRLLAYVESGGTLLLSRPHVSTNLRRFQPTTLPDSPSLRRLLGAGGDPKSRCTSGYVGMGTPFERATRKIVRNVGKGKVIFFPQDAYPCERVIRRAYEAELAAIGREASEAERDRGWVRGSKDVNFAAWDRPASRLRTIYLLNIDWWTGRKAAPATLLLGQREIPIHARAGMIETVTVCGNHAFMPETDDVDVLDVQDRNGRVTVTVQSDGPSRLRVYWATGPSRLINIPNGGISRLAV